MIVGIGDFCGSRLSPDWGGNNLNMKAGKRKERRVQLIASGVARAVAGCLLLSLAACGAPVSEKAPGPAPSASKGETAGAGVVVGAAQRGSDQNDRKSVAAGRSDSDTEERDNRSIPGVPDMVVRDLGSADPRDRSRALEHWMGKGVQAPMDPVFEAMEDEDDEVSEKATAIIEQRWAEEQQKERG